jgi:hypothetical protein
VILGTEDVAVLYGWDQEATSGRRIARVDIRRGASSLEMIDFWVDGSAVPRIRSFAQSGPTQPVDEKVMRALTMVIQDRIRLAFDEGELVGPIGLSPEEIKTAIDYAKAPHDLDTAAVAETPLWPNVG